MQRGPVRRRGRALGGLSRGGRVDRRTRRVQRRPRHQARHEGVQRMARRRAGARGAGARLSRGAPLHAGFHRDRGPRGRAALRGPAPCANWPLFAAMVQNGFERGREFSVAAIRERWLQFLEEDVAPAYDRQRANLDSRHLWHVRAMAAQKALSRAHRLRGLASAGRAPRTSRRGGRRRPIQAWARPTTSPWLPDRPAAARIDSSAARA